MLGTLFSIIIAILEYFYAIPKDIAQAAPFFAVAIFVVSSLFILIQTLITISAWTPLQKNEQNLTPRILELFKKDRNLRITNYLLLIFLLVTYLIFTDLMFFNLSNKGLLLITWTILLGLAIDITHHSLRKILNYLNPFHAVDLYLNEATDAILESNVPELCSWVDTLSESSQKGIIRNCYSLSLLALDKLRIISREYLEIAKGVTYHEEDENVTGIKGQNQVSFTLFYLFERIEAIFKKALKEQIDLICKEVLTVLGKLTLYCAKFDITMASYPIHYLGKLAILGQREGLSDLGSHATLTMGEVSKLIIKELDIKYLELQDPFLSMLSYMHEIAKKTFQEDKSINIQILINPFQDLLALFQGEKVATHPDAGPITQRIHAILDEFTALESVIRTMPPSEEEKKEEKGI